MNILNKILNIHTVRLENINLGELKTVISFSLYGDANKYLGGLIDNCKQINKIYPDFWIYVYLGNDFDRNTLNSKFDYIKNLLFIETGKSGHEVMSYRFFSIDRPEVGIAFSRDADSMINARDQYCINEFIKSDKKFQIIRDNPSHKTEILGGMWGIKKGLLAFKIEQEFEKYKIYNLNFIHGSDQIFLSKHIYPIVKPYALVFDEYFTYRGETPQKINAPMTMFPTGPDYVGRVWDTESWFTYV